MGECRMKKVCMIVQDKMVKGGIAAVISGYYGSKLEQDYNMIYVESYKDGGKFTKLLKGICGYIYFAKVLLVDKPDLVHIHSSFGPSFYRKMPFIYMASWARKPIINHIHGADFDEFYVNTSEKKKRQVKRVYSKCTRLIALSDEWKERLSKIVTEDKITVIENYSVLHEDALEERLHRPSNNLILFLGELGKRKGCYDIPKVAKRVIQAVPDVKFILAGTGSQEDEIAIKQLFADIGIDEYILFPGWVRGEQKDRLLREADIFFLPSYNEGMPMSILDAMGYGLPIVSTKVGGISKIVYDGKNGYLTEPGRVENMADNIVCILQDDRLRIKMGKCSMENVKIHHSLTKHLEALKTVYEGVIK